MAEGRGWLQVPATCPRGGAGPDTLKDTGNGQGEVPITCMTLSPPPFARDWLLAPETLLN